MNKRKGYFYPNSAKKKPEDSNPYSFFLMEGIQKEFDILNSKTPSKTGFYDFVKYLRKIDFLFVNWIENLPDKRYGVWQSFLFLFLITLKKFFGFKLIWVMHNKVSHSKKNYRIKKIIYKNLIRKSDLIFTHSTEGERIIKKVDPGNKKVIFIHHPVRQRKNTIQCAKKEYDLLIWGNITPYKGIREFVEFLNENQQKTNVYRILIAGKFLSDTYFESINKFSLENLFIDNSFIDEDYLDTLIQKSKIILFTYKTDSVLSSGALMKTLEHHSLILGPDYAAFADLEKEGVIFTYKNYPDLFEKVKQLLKPSFDSSYIFSKQEYFTENHSWENSIATINQIINNTFK